MAALVAHALVVLRRAGWHPARFGMATDRPGSLVAHPSCARSRLVSELGPNAFGEPVEPGRVDCYLSLPFPLRASTALVGAGGGAALAAAPGRPQPAGSLVYELATGHPDRQAGELVFPAELRAWPQERQAALGVDCNWSPVRRSAADDCRSRRGRARTIDGQRPPVPPCSGLRPVPCPALFRAAAGVRGGRRPSRQP